MRRLVILALFASYSFAFPQLLSLDGFLTNSSGSSLNGSYSFVFSLYNVSSGGTALWTETQILQVSSGKLNALLGSVTALNLPFDQDYYLGVKVSADSEMSPRYRVASSAYAYTAKSLAPGANASGDLYVSGKVGIGTTSPVKRVEVADTNVEVFRVTGTGAAAGVGLNSNATGGLQWNLFSSANAAGEGGGKLLFNLNNVGTKMLIDSSGNVGIGTASPASKLVVAGNKGVSSEVYANQGIADNDAHLKLSVYDSTDSSKAIYDQYYYGWSGDPGTAAVPWGRSSYFEIPSNGRSFNFGNTAGQWMTIKNGNVGINTTNPSEPLSVYGTTSGDGRVATFNSGASQSYITLGGIACNSGFFEYNHVSNYFALGRHCTFSGAKTGIGRVPTTYALELEGDASKTTAGSWQANSDRRIKTDVSAIDSAVSVLGLLRPVRFKYTDDYKAQHPSIKDKYYYNFIAQEFQQVFPEEVTLTNDTLPGGERILAIDPYILTPYLVRAVQEQDGRIRDLTAENAVLKEKNADLESRVSAIEQKLK